MELGQKRAVVRVGVDVGVNSLPVWLPILITGRTLSCIFVKTPIAFISPLAGQG